MATAEFALMALYLELDCTRTGLESSQVGSGRFHDAVPSGSPLKAAESAWYILGGGKLSSFQVGPELQGFRLLLRDSVKC